MYGRAMTDPDAPAVRTAIDVRATTRTTPERGVYVPSDYRGINAAPAAHADSG